MKSISTLLALIVGFSATVTPALAFPGENLLNNLVNQYQNGNTPYVDQFGNPIGNVDQFGNPIGNQNGGLLSGLLNGVAGNPYNVPPGVLNTPFANQPFFPNGNIPVGYNYDDNFIAQAPFNNQFNNFNGNRPNWQKKRMKQWRKARRAAMGNGNCGPGMGRGNGNGNGMGRGNGNGWGRGRGNGNAWGRGNGNGNGYGWNN